ncbi:hypothetical protein LCO01nite_12620 [Lapidilactobacillus concavus]|uniref:acyltransferase n=1 Tax=Lapidilactobacillus concavus TaxID=287844 RepID=UPI00070E1542|nr:acyltransferase [Lapidilactobacillus concavus]GEL13713.1 hypothetical protein LCO01nite_12620 [Lapidilactobacillus concavus]
MSPHIKSFIMNTIASGSIIPMKVRIGLYRSQSLRIGNDVIIGPHNYIFANNVEISDNSFINNHVSFQNGAGNVKIKIGNNGSIAPNVLFEGSTHIIGPKNKRAGEIKYTDIYVDDGCWIGCNVTILPGITIAKGCVIGAGAVVTKNTAPNGLYVGVPAKRVKDLD